MILRYSAKKDINRINRLGLDCDICDSPINIWDGYYTCDNPDCDVDFCRDCVECNAVVDNIRDLQKVQTIQIDCE
jgi:hypothetical protein